ncbi:MAG: FtsX-like permease family protein [Planctomycetota bacterium]|nr:MAG: FtsX-like permease family protein [Planctomycetota bacterium]
MLGVIIGVAAVILMVSMGRGAQSQVRENMTRLGSDLLWVRPERARSQRGVAAGEVGTLSLRDARAIEQELAALHDGVAPEVTTSEQVKYFSRNTRTTIRGTVPIYAHVRNSPVVEGRWFDDDDVRRHRRVAVIGRIVADELFQGAAAVGQTIKIRGVNFEVVGVLEEKGESWLNPDDQVIVPLSTARRVFTGRSGLRMITVKARSREVQDQLQKEIERVLRREHGIDPGEDPDFRVRNQSEYLAALDTNMRVLTMLLAGVALVSLIVGGIGIMNIMLVTVTERTREIGIRKALGATRLDILRQFLIESIVIAGLGGAIGVALGGLGSWQVARMAGWQPVLPPTVVAVAVGFSALTGIVFGVFPALKAARLDPIEALRYE